MRIVNLFVPIAYFYAMTGCTTYIGHKLDSTGKLPDQATTGIPFVMTKPEYSVDIASDPSDPTKSIYTLRSENVPDPSQRYTLALDPSFLVDGSYESIYGDQGNITSSWSKSTSKVIATIESAVSYGLDKAAANAMMDAGTTWGTYTGIVVSTAEPDCVKTVNNTTIKNSIIESMISLTDKAKNELDAVDTETIKAANRLAAARFHYLDKNQKLCLISVLGETSDYFSEGLEKAESDYSNSITALRGSTTDTALNNWLSALENAVKNSDISAIKKLSKHRPTSNAETTANLALKYVNEQNNSRNLRNMGRFYANMSSEVWKARHLQYLETQLDQMRLDKLVATKGGPPPKGHTDRIKIVETEWAATLGAQKLIDRIAELDRFLSKVQITSGAPGSPSRYAAPELVLLRDERDKLQQQVDGLRESILSKNQLIDTLAKKEKIKTRIGISVTLANKSFIDAVENSPGAISGLPEFVLVLEPSPITTIHTSPIEPPASPNSREEK